MALMGLELLDEVLDTGREAASTAALPALVSLRVVIAV